MASSKVTGSPLADCTMRSLSGRICSRTAAALVAGFGMPDRVTRETSAHSLTHPLPRRQSSARLSRSLVEYTPGVDVLALAHERFENYRAVVTGNGPCVTYAHGLCRGTIGLGPSLHHHSPGVLPMPRLNFGAFLAPHHPIGEHPMLQFRRDLDLVEHLDKLGYDEFWCGEHHSSGWEMIGSPEMFLAAAGERSKRIKLATGWCPCRITIRTTWPNE